MPFSFIHKFLFRFQQTMIHSAEGQSNWHCLTKKKERQKEKTSLSLSLCTPNEQKNRKKN